MNSPFINITGANLPHGYINSIAVDPNDAAKVLIAFSNYNIISIFYSPNAGRRWYDVSGNLEEFPNGTGRGPSIRCVKILPVHGSNLYFAGTSVGLFVTAHLSDRTRWIRQAPEKIGHEVVESLDVRPLDGTVVVGTFGKGVFSTQFKIVDAK